MATSRVDRLAPRADGLGSGRFVRRFFPLFFLLVYGGFVLAFCFIQPPFEIPDESAHFFRTVQVSRFDFGPHFTPETPSGGAFLPAALNDFAVQEIFGEGRHERVRTPQDRLKRVRADAEKQRPLTLITFLDMPNEVIYHPLYYLPQAIAVAVARPLSDRVYVWFYAARVFNALTAVLLLSAALWLSRDQQFVLVSIVALPTSLSQIASASPDAWQIAGMLLFVSLCIRLRERGETTVQWIAAVLGIWLITVRPVLIVAVLLAPLTANMAIGWRRVLRLTAAIAVPAILLSVQWSHEAGQAYLGTEAAWHSDPQAQIRCLLQDPLHLFTILRNTWIREHEGLYMSFIGHLGWMAVFMPYWFYVWAPILLVLIFAVSFVPRKALSLSGLVVAVGFLSVVSATLASMYLLFTPPCTESIYGMQGRYFLAPLALGALVCGTETKSFSRRYLAAAVLCVLLMVLSFGVAATKTYRTYYRHPVAAAKAIPKGHIESPAPDSHVNERLEVSGWAAATSAIDHVTIDIDGHERPPVRCDIPRPDVDDAVNGAAPGNKGWKAILDASSWTPGEHVITVRAFAADRQSGVLGHVKVAR